MKIAIIECIAIIVIALIIVIVASFGNVYISAPAGLLGMIAIGFIALRK